MEFRRAEPRHPHGPRGAGAGAPHTRAGRPRTSTARSVVGDCQTRRCSVHTFSTISRSPPPHRCGSAPHSRRPASTSGGCTASSSPRTSAPNRWRASGRPGGHRRAPLSRPPRAVVSTARRPVHLGSAPRRSHSLAWCLDVTALLATDATATLGSTLSELTNVLRQHGLIPVTTERFA